MAGGLSSIFRTQHAPTPDSRALHITYSKRKSNTRSLDCMYLLIYVGKTRTSGFGFPLEICGSGLSLEVHKWALGRVGPGL